jgi:uncharacterized repeat protein (TIGR01451 family)
MSGISTDRIPFFLFRKAGSNITYTVMVSNQGPDDAQNFNLTNVLPSGVIFVSQTQNSNWLDLYLQGGTQARSA